MSSLTIDMDLTVYVTNVESDNWHGSDSIYKWGLTNDHSDNWHGSDSIFKWGLTNDQSNNWHGSAS